MGAMEQIKKAQRRRLMIFQGLVVVLILIIIGGLGFVFFQFTTGSWVLFTTPTPTATITPSPIIPTATLYLSPTPTVTPTITPSPTRSGPITHAVAEGESLFYIAELYQVTIDLLIQYNLQETGVDLSTSLLAIGQEVLIPPPDFEIEIPTATPIPDNLRPGTLIEYTVRPGDLLGIIAETFNTTVDAILEENEIENPDNLAVGTVLQIPYNLITLTPVTPSATSPPTGTPTPGPSPTASATATVSATGTP